MSTKYDDNASNLSNYTTNTQKCQPADGPLTGHHCHRYSHTARLPKPTHPLHNYLTFFLNCDLTPLQLLTWCIHIYDINYVTASQFSSICSPYAVSMVISMMFLLTDESRQRLPRWSWVHTNPQARLADCFLLDTVFCNINPKSTCTDP